MIRPRRSSRNAGKKAQECRERLRRCIADEDWDCSSEEDGVSETEEEVEGNNGSSSASTRSSVKRVASVIAKFDEEKRELVKSIGFGGLLELPQINKVSRRFTVWLLSRLDTDNRTIEFGGEIQVEMVDFDVHRILGIPCGPFKVSPLCPDDARARKMFMQQMIGASANESNSLLAAGRIVALDYGGKMDESQRERFKVSFVVFVVGYLLAPTTKNNVGNSSFWGALADPGNIYRYNWGEYVLEHLIEAAVKVQADIRNKKKIANITWCSILLQVMYLETLKVPGAEMTRDVYPRIKLYTANYLNRLVEADMASSSSGSCKVSWGATILRRNSQMERSIPETVLLDKLKGCDDFSENLATFAKENFSGKLSETHINALIAYGERCNTHFSTLKDNLMKESLFLVEILMCGAYKEESVQKTGHAGSFEGRKTDSLGATMFPNQSVMGSLRGYESSSEGSKTSRRSGGMGATHCRGGNGRDYAHCMGMNSADGGGVSSDPGLPARRADSGEGQDLNHTGSGSPEPPSFDLGYDYQTQEKYMLAKRSCVEAKKCVVPVTAEAAIEVPLQMKGPDEHEGHVKPAFGTLGRTPSSCKRKADGMTWISPDQRFKSATTSPASMSKLLADGAVFARMLRSEEGLDMNIQPWEHDTTNSPVVKKTVVSDRLAKSPWFHGMAHKLCPIESAAGFLEQLLTGTGQYELERTWVAHRSPRFLEVSGSCIKDSFSMKVPFDYDLYDIALRRINQLENILYQTSNDKRWRHILESDFAVLSQADEKPAYHKTIREQFYGAGVRYNINRCRMVVIPAQVLMNWCCYFWDFKKKVIHVVDPLYNEEQSAYYKKLHGPIVDKIGAELANCIDIFFDNWNVDWSEWQQSYVVPKIRVVHRNESALASLMSILEFDGEGFRNMTEDTYKQFKAVLLGEIMAMEDNQVKPPLVFSPPKKAAPLIFNIDDD